MIDIALTDLPDIKASDFKYEQFREVLLRLEPLQQYDICLEAQREEDVDRICEGFLKVLKGQLNLEEISALYTVSILLLLLNKANGDCSRCNRRLELLNECFNYSDMLKPTMMHYVTGDMLEHIKYTSDQEEHYQVYLLEAIPHMLVSSETGKMISLGLLRALVANLAKHSIVMHIYRNLWEIWQMIKVIPFEAILQEWSMRKTYILIKSYALLMTTAGLNGKNIALKQAGYRGFEMPPNPTEIGEWFKTLRDKLEAKHKESKSKTGLMLVRFIDYNILSLLTELGHEATSDAGQEAAA